MPSPIGHTLAGLAVGWLTEPVPAERPASWRATFTPFALWCGLVAALPDADLLIPHAHRSATHSVTATLLILIVGMVVTGKVTRRPARTFVVALAAAHATHLLLDWLGMDRFPPPGIQLFWPFLDRFYISGVDLFPPVERRLLRPEALAINAHAALWELMLIGPIALAAWMLRARARRRESSIAREGVSRR